MSMGFLPVLLWTDVLLWLLVAAIAGYGWRCSRRPHLAAPWARVFRTRSAAVTSVVLACYVVVALPTRCISARGSRATSPASRWPTPAG